jgi:hypothetical protein
VCARDTPEVPNITEATSMAYQIHATEGGFSTPVQGFSLLVLDLHSIVVIETEGCEGEPRHCRLATRALPSSGGRRAVQGS